MKKVYYNEFDPKAGEWLKVLIEQKLIPDGVVDTRSIKDVKADEIKEFTQCHFFAGIGGWSYALQLAGIDPSEPLWTGSCPCQPYSQAGRGKGFDDERDLWPVWFNLIKECRPAKVFGEQVERAIKHGWLDRVYADMEREGYACGAAILGAHSVNAPHQRQRLYFGCVFLSNRCGKRYLHCESKKQSTKTELNAFNDATQNSFISGLSYSKCKQFSRSHDGCRKDSETDTEKLTGYCPDNSLAENSTCRGCRGRDNGSETGNNREIQASGLCTRDDVSLVNGIESGLERHAGNGNDRKEPGRNETEQAGSITKAGCNGILGNSESNKQLRNTDSQNRQGQQIGRSGGFDLSSISPWDDFVLVLCRDTDKNGNHKVRRVPAESVFLRMDDGIHESVDIGRPDRAFPLCQSSSFKKGQIAMLLKGYGNAIVPHDAAVFMKSFMEIIAEAGNDE